MAAALRERGIGGRTRSSPRRGAGPAACASSGRPGRVAARSAGEPLPPSLEVRVPERRARPTSLRALAESCARCRGHRRRLRRGGAWSGSPPSPGRCAGRAGRLRGRGGSPRVVIVSATLQLAIYARREEIEIQKLVGAHRPLRQGALPHRGRCSRGWSARRWPSPGCGPSGSLCRPAARERSSLPGCRGSAAGRPRLDGGRSSSRWPGRRWGWAGASSPWAGSCGYEACRSSSLRALAASRRRPARPRSADALEGQRTLVAALPRSVGTRGAACSSATPRWPGHGGRARRRRSRAAAERARAPAAAAEAEEALAPGGARAGWRGSAPAPHVYRLTPAAARSTCCCRPRTSPPSPGGRVPSPRSWDRPHARSTSCARWRASSARAWRSSSASSAHDGRRLFGCRAEAEEAAGAARPSSARRCSSSRRRRRAAGSCWPSSRSRAAAAGWSRRCCRSRTPPASARSRASCRCPPRGQVEVAFGKVVHPKFNTVTVQKGLDIRAPAGTPVQAVAPGNGRVERVAPRLRQPRHPRPRRRLPLALCAPGRGAPPRWGAGLRPVRWSGRWGTPARSRGPTSTSRFAGAGSPWTRALGRARRWRRAP